MSARPDWIDPDFDRLVTPDGKLAWVLDRAAQILMKHPDCTVMVAMVAAWTEHELIYGSSTSKTPPVGILGKSPISQWKAL